MKRATSAIRDFKVVRRDMTEEICDVVKSIEERLKMVLSRDLLREGGGTEDRWRKCGMRRVESSD